MSLAELLVASGILLALTAAAGAVLARAQLTFRAQPEVADMQQRLRVARAGDRARPADGRRRSRVHGAGRPARCCALPPVAPYRRGQIDDARAGVFYRPDAVSVVYVPGTRAEADIVRAVDTGRELLVDAAPNCGALVHERVCGFTVGMRVVLFDAPRRGSMSAP